jgi:hypothetical protein
MAAQAGHGLTGGALVLRGDGVPLLGIETGGDLGRVDQVAEQDRQVAPLAGFGGEAAGTCPKPVDG